MQTKCGFDTWRTTTGTKKTVVGFQPKLLFVAAVPDTTANVLANDFSVCFGIGAMGSDPSIGTNQIGSVVWNQNGTLLDNKNYHKIQNILMTLMANETTVLVQASLVSFDVDGFTIDYTTVDGQPYRFAYLAIGGNEITQTYLGAHNFTWNATVPPYHVPIYYSAPFPPDYQFCLQDWKRSTDNDFGMMFQVGSFTDRRSKYIYFDYPWFPTTSQFYLKGTRTAGNTVSNPDWGTICRSKYGGVNEPTTNFYGFDEGGYDTNGIRITTSGLMTDLTAQFYYLAVQGSLETGFIQNGLSGGLPAPTWDLTLHNITNPQAMMLFYGGYEHANDPAIMWGVGFVDELGNQAQVIAINRDITGAGNPTVARHGNFDNAVWTMYKASDLSLVSKYSFNSWIPDPVDGKLRLNKDFRNWTAPVSGDVISSMSFGVATSGQIVGQTGMIN